jgi:hypothetical protein
MKTKILGWMVGLGALVPSFISCSQPKVQCQVGLAGAYGYATTYVVKGAMPACAMDPAFSIQKGDVIGFETYNPPNADKSTYDSTKGSVAVQADSLGIELGNAGPGPNADDKNDHLYSLGDWASVDPDASSFCSVPKPVPAHQTIAAIADDPMVIGADCTPDTAADDCPGFAACDDATMKCVSTLTDEQKVDHEITYDWTNLKFYVTADAPGSQFSADLKYTLKTSAGLDCTIEYHAVGMWPAVGCGADADCSPCANPDAGVATGSGINPSFPTRCDTDLGLCVLRTADKDSTASEIPQITDKTPDCGEIN